MSRSSLFDFMERTLNDKPLRKKVATLRDDDYRGLINLAASLGYTIEMRDFMYVLQTSDQLDDSQLAQVAGGINSHSLQPGVASSFVKLNPGLINGIIVIGGRQP